MEIFLILAFCQILSHFDKMLATSRDISFQNDPNDHNIIGWECTLHTMNHSYQEVGSKEISIQGEGALPLV